MNSRARMPFIAGLANCVRHVICMRRVLVYGGLALLSSQTCAALPPNVMDKLEERLSTLTEKRFQWDQYEAMQLSGMPTYVRSFTSVDPIIEAARALAVHSDIFQRVLTFRNRIVLSGLEPGWHWLAEIEPAANGSRGYVSALYVDAKGANPTTVGFDRSFQWLPAVATKRFSLHLEEGSNTVIQQVYSVALAPDELFAYVGRRLRGEGWAQDPTFTAYESSSWSRKEARITLFPQADADGTSVFVQYVE